MQVEVGQLYHDLPELKLRDRTRNSFQLLPENRINQPVQQTRSTQHGSTRLRKLAVTTGTNCFLATPAPKTDSGSFIEEKPLKPKQFRSGLMPEPDKEGRPVQSEHFLKTKFSPQLIVLLTCSWISPEILFNHSSARFDFSR
jgi:hypothetical protein